MYIYYIIRNNDLHTRPNYNVAIYRHVHGALYIVFMQYTNMYTVQSALFSILLYKSK